MKIAVLVTPGINCYEESAFAIEQTGASPQIVLDTDLLDNRIDLREFGGVMIPGGFSFGDHFGAGRVTALVLGEYLREFAALQRPVLGICNGFQILMEAGLFNQEPGCPAGALVQNASKRFESRIITVLPEEGSPWTENIPLSFLQMPVAHGEGRWSPSKHEHLTVTFRYSCWNVATCEYPGNPGGAYDSVAGLAYGLVMGMMPHPERAVLPTQGSTDGQYIFRALVRLARS